MDYAHLHSEETKEGLCGLGTMQDLVHPSLKINS